VLAGGFVIAVLALPVAAYGQDEGAAGDPAQATPETPASPTAPAGEAEGAASVAEARAAGRRPRRKAVVRVSVRGASTDHRLQVASHAVVTAVIHPFIRGQRVKLYLRRGDHTIMSKVKKVRHRIPGTKKGLLVMRGPRVVRPGRYIGKAVHKASRRLDRDGDYRTFSLQYPSLSGGSGRLVELFNDLLNVNGYRNAPNGDDYNDATRRAVLAFRKTNGLERTTSAPASIFRALAGRQGEFKPSHPDAGRHVEVDISRQVMALISGGEAQYTYHVSTGAPATPTVRGHYHFYRRQPGFNAVGMYYSVYFVGGYATHGYHSVPNYPASHGCVRNPIPDSRFIYNWIELGMSIYVHG
jgi:L,D-transpeptidase catalytic domain